jgi:hypothetical protein
MRNVGRSVLGWVLAVVGVFFLVAGVMGTDGFAKDAPSKITVKSKRGDVTFSHDAHAKDAKIACAKCHHNLDKAKDQHKCSDCHKAQKEGDVSSLKDAFHNSCTKCHKAEKAKKADTKAPTLCNDCHKK